MANQTVKMDTDGNVMVETLDTMAALVTKMGYDGLTGWQQDTGVEPGDLLGKWWTVCRDRVYLEDGPVGEVDTMDVADL